MRSMRCSLFQSKSASLITIKSRVMVMLWMATDAMCYRPMPILFFLFCFSFLFLFNVISSILSGSAYMGGTILTNELW